MHKPSIRCLMKPSTSITQRLLEHQYTTYRLSQPAALDNGCLSINKPAIGYHG